MTTAEAIVAKGIANDAAYVGRFVSDARNPKFASFVGVVSLCMVPYLSLFVHESYRKLRTSDPALASPLSSDMEAIVASSRHSLKLFEDTHHGVAGQLAYFCDILQPAHTRRFLGNTWLPLARPLEKDLGLFSYAGRLITTTHSANFHMGVEPHELFAKTGPEVRRIYEQYGRYFARLGTRLGAGGSTFLCHLDARRFPRGKDVRTADYYPSVFDGLGSPDLNALLTAFRGMMNFVDSVITAGMDANVIDYTVFKIRFLTLYQILGSLRMLRDEGQPHLTSRSVAFIERITGTSGAEPVMEPAVKPFRNTLMHYNLDSRVDTTRVDVNQPLFGLVPIYFPTYDTTTFTATVDRCISETAAAIEEWAGT